VSLHIAQKLQLTRQRLQLIIRMKLLGTQADAEMGDWVPGCFLSPQSFGWPFCQTVAT
jgi:hypothetical protein